MGDEEDGAVDLIEKARNVGRVGAHAAERIGRSDDLIALLLQTFDHSVPTGRVGEGTVYDYDSWLSVGVHYAYLLSSGSALLAEPGSNTCSRGGRDRCLLCTPKEVFAPFLIFLFT